MQKMTIDAADAQRGDRIPRFSARNPEVVSGHPTVTRDEVIIPLADGSRYVVDRHATLEVVRPGHGGPGDI